MDITAADSSEKESLTPAGRKRWSLVLVLGSLSAFGPLSLDMYLPSLPALAADLGTGMSQTQLSLTFCLIGLALGQLLAGPASDVYGRRKPLLIGLTAYTLSSMLCAFAPSIWVLLALRLIQGLSGAVGIVLSRAVARDLYAGKELTRFLSLLMLVNGAAPILAPVFGGQLLNWVSWRGVFVTLTLIGGAMMTAVTLLLPESLSPDKRTPAGLGSTLAAFRSLAADRWFMGLAVSQGMVYAGMFAYIAGSPFVLQKLYGVSPQGFSLIFAANGLGIIAASQLTGRLVRRIEESRLMSAGIGLAFCGGILLTAALWTGAGLPLILPALFLAVGSVGVVAAAGTSLALQRYARSAGSASALLGVLSYIIGGLVSPLVGLWGEDTAWPMAVIILAAESLAVGSALFTLRRR